MKHPPDLSKLREASEERLIFGMGLLEGKIPYIHMYFDNWTRDMLALVRKVILMQGLQIRVKRLTDQNYSLYMASRAMIQVEAQAHGHTSVLKCPAWDATLEPIESEAYSLFEAGRIKLGTYNLLFQAPEWEFLCSRDRSSPSMDAGEVTRRQHPLPPEEIRHTG